MNKTSAPSATHWQIISSQSVNSQDDFGDYQFTTDWFSCNKPHWSAIFNQLQPRKILEIGSYEGRSTCFLIEELSRRYECEIHCLDAWIPQAEHSNTAMDSVESRFMHNVKKSLKNVKHKVNLHVHKGLSQNILPKLLAGGGAGYFDFIYIDGSHVAPDVLFDAVLSFQLLAKSGVIAFDDYLWITTAHPKDKDYLNHPKIAIDAFVNIFSRKTNVLTWLPLYQLYVQKITD